MELMLRVDLKNPTAKCLVVNDPSIQTTTIQIEHIDTAQVANWNDVLFGTTKVCDVITQYLEFLTQIPIFRQSQLSDKWYAEISVKEFGRLKIAKHKQFINQKVLNKYPEWRQVNLTNDKDHALIALSCITTTATTDIMAKIVKEIPINSNSAMNDINAFSKQIDAMDYRQFAYLNPTVFQVDELKKHIKPVLKFLVYYYSMCRIRTLVARDEAKCLNAPTYEEVLSVMTVDPTI